MKITIDSPLLTYEYLERLVSRGEGECVEDIVEGCFISGLDRIYEADLADGTYTAAD